MAARRRAAIARYGGGFRFGAQRSSVEILFSMLMAPIGGLPPLRLPDRVAVWKERSGWGGQNRDAYGLTWRGAGGALWGATAFGLALVALLSITAPQVLPYAAPVLAGLLLAVPIAVLTAAPGFAGLLERFGLGDIPENTTPHPLLEAIDRETAALAGRSDPVAAEVGPAVKAGASPRAA